MNSANRASFYGLLRQRTVEALWTLAHAYAVAKTVLVLALFVTGTPSIDPGDAILAILTIIILPDIVARFVRRYRRALARLN